MVTESAAEPLVSVVMPAYHHAPYVEEAIRSVWAQTYENIELIVVDDGSTDKTPNIVARLAESAPIPMEIARKENGGIASALNVGIDRSRGELVALLASDDRMLDRRIERQVREMRQRPRVGILHTSAYRVDENGEFLFSMTGSYVPARGDCLREFMLGRAGVVSPTIMLRRSVIDHVGRFDEDLPIEDWPYFLRAASRGVQFGYIDEELTCWRRTSGSAGGRTSLAWRSSIAERKKYLPLFEAGDAERMLSRMYTYEFESALLQGRYSVAAEIFSEARRASQSALRLAQIGGWSLARNFTRSVLPPSAYQLLKKSLRRGV